MPRSRSKPPAAAFLHLAKTRVSLPAALLMLGAVGTAIVISSDVATAADNQTRDADGATLPDAADPQPATLADAVRLMSEPDHSRRQTITLAIWRDRDRWRDAIGQAVDHPDPEIAARAKWVLRRWRLGIGPETPPRIAALLESNLSQENVGKLLRLGQFRSLADRLAEGTANTETATLRALVTGDINVRFASHIMLAHREDKLDDFLALLDQIANRPDLALCRLELMRIAGVEVTAENRLPAALRFASEDQTQVILAALLAADERYAEAIETLGDDEGRKLRVSLAAADYPAVVDHWKAERDRPEGAAVDDSQSLLRERRLSSAWLAAAVAADRIDDPKLREQAIGEVIQPIIDRLRQDQAAGDQTEVAEDDAGEDTADDRQQATEALLSELVRQREVAGLLITGHVAAAIDLAETFDTDLATQLAIRTKRFPRALQLLSAETSSVDRKHAFLKPEVMRQAVKKAVRIQAESADRRGGRFGRVQRPEFCEEIQTLLRQLEILLSLGKQSEAESLAKQLSRQSLKARIGQEQRVVARLNAIREGVFETLGAIGVQSADNRRCILEILDMAGDGPTQAAIKSLTVGQENIDEKSFVAVYKCMGSILPKADAVARTRATLQLFAGELPDGFDPAEDFASLVSQLQNPDDKNPLPRFQQFTGTSALQVADMLRRNGQIELAGRYLNGLAMVSDIEAWLREARRLLDDGDVESALTFVSSLLDPDDGIAWISGTHLVRAQVIECEALGRLGRSDLEQQARQRFDLVMCTPRLDQRSDFAESIATLHDPDKMVASLRRSMTVSIITSSGATFYTPVFQYESLVKEMRQRGAHTDAATVDLQERHRPSHWFQVGTLEPLGFQPKFWPYLAWQTANMRLDEALHREDESDATRMVDRLLEVRKLNILLGEDSVAQMRKIKWDSLARNTLDSVLQSGLEHLESFAHDASVLNNMAWVAAASDHRLDEALKWSRLAVEIEPDEVIYRDTLAEVLFRLGRAREALLIERACLLDTPRDWHLHEQIERFGKPKE